MLLLQIAAFSAAGGFLYGASPNRVSMDPSQLCREWCMQSNKFLFSDMPFCGRKADWDVG